MYVKDPGRGVLYFRRGSAASALTRDDAATIDLDGVDVVHVSGITPAISQSASEFLPAVIERARARGILVSFDVNFRPALWDTATAAPVLLEIALSADLVFTGSDEAEALWGISTLAAIRAMLPGVPELVVKDGDLGATAFLGNTVAFERALLVEVIEPVGAGDAFAGGYLAARFTGAAVAERLMAGHQRAARTLRTTTDSVDDLDYVDERTGT